MSQGFRLSLILNAVGSEVASAGIEIHTISKGVTLFSLMLKQVGQHLQARDSVHSEEALDTAKQITDECQQVFDEITDMLDKVQSKRSDGSYAPNLQQRFKWCFKKHRVTYLLGQLESLKLNLLVMLGILQLGKLIVTPPKRYVSTISLCGKTLILSSQAKEDLAVKDDMVLQERAETQNIIIVRYWATSRLDRLYIASEQEELEDRKAEAEAGNEKLLENGQPRLSIEGPPSPTSNALIRYPVISLGQLDQALNRIRESPRDMLQVTDSVIDPLLNRWTRCHEIMEYQASHGTSRPGSRAEKYAPSVNDLSEQDEDPSHGHPPPQYHSQYPPQYPSQYPHSDDSSGSTQSRRLFLEGVTTNWRQPQSSAARKEMKERKKQYANFQPSVDEDAEHQPMHSKRPPPSRHVIDSSDSSTSLTDSDSEYEKKQRRRRRRTSSASTPEQKHKKGGPPRLQYPDGPNQGRYASSPTTSHTSGSFPRAMLSSPHSPLNPRPSPHHSMSTPMIPPLHTGNVPNPYQNAQGTGPSPYAPYASPGYSPRVPMPSGPPGQLPLPGGQAPPLQSQRLQPGQTTGQRPPSSDGKARSSSRHSMHSSASQASSSHRDKRLDKAHLRRGATRSILGAGAIAGFLEALEGLSI